MKQKWLVMALESRPELFPSIPAWLFHDLISNFVKPEKFQLEEDIFFIKLITSL